MKGIQIILGNAGTQLEILETPECNVVDERPTPIEVLEEETLGRRAWLAGRVGPPDVELHQPNKPRDDAVLWVGDVANKRPVGPFPRLGALLQLILLDLPEAHPHAPQPVDERDIKVPNAPMVLGIELLAPPVRLREPRFGARERIRERNDQEDSLNILEAITACCKVEVTRSLITSGYAWSVTFTAQSDPLQVKWLILTPIICRV